MNFFKTRIPKQQSKLRRLKRHGVEKLTNLVKDYTMSKEQKTQRKNENKQALKNRKINRTFIKNK
jgi:hypothetical protein